MSDNEDYRDESTGWDTASYPVLPGAVSAELTSTYPTNNGRGVMTGEDTDTANTLSYTPVQQGGSYGSSDTYTLSQDRGVYTSYAGTDIVAQMIVPGESPLTLGELETFSYSIHREKTPVRMLGRVDPQAFLSSQRTIAGTMIIMQFNNYMFYRLEQLARGVRSGLYPLGDMLPPFDMVLTFANEYGVFSKLRLFGVSIIDEGGTMSIEDLVTEGTINYIAKGIQPLTGYYVEGYN